MQIEAAMEEVAEKVLEKSKRKQTKKWFEDECKQVLEKRNRARLRFLEDASEINNIQYNRRRKEVKEGSENFYQEVKKSKNSNAGRPPYSKSEGGTLVGSTEGKLKMFAQYFSRVLKENEDEVNPEEEKVGGKTDYFAANAFDIIAVSETWWPAGIGNDLVSLDGYKLIRKDRSDGRRGDGVALFVKSTFKCLILNIETTANDYEQLWIRLVVNNICICTLAVGVVYKEQKLDNTVFTVGVVYKEQKLDNTVFITSFEDILSRIIIETHELVVLGDFNINLLKTNTKAYDLLKNMCDSLDLVQVVHDPTRITPTSMSLVELILVLSSASVISSGVLYDLVISDHSLTFVKLDVQGPSCEPCRKGTLKLPPCLSSGEAMNKHFIDSVSGTVADPGLLSHHAYLVVKR
ncbi:hypothetical protein QE152_g8911 [Popillia japonica]|uniref:Endonuclease/exonuclease/phosphatase domain-containing protein n=1 Tax=Popillia japonica TaxID=7064 RepID=A0AAW1LWM6_POPJA